MDAAVLLARAYLSAFGYFTLVEYPVVESRGHNDYRMATDIDLMGIRLPGAGRLIPHASDPEQDQRFDSIDPALDAPDDRMHIVIAEVKEGRAELNRGARNVGVLRAALARIGRHPEGDDTRIIDALRRHGRYDDTRFRIQVIAFGSYAGDRGPFRVITFRHVVRTLRATGQEHWPVLHTAQFKDPALGFLALLEKSRFDRPEREDQQNQQDQQS